MPFIDAKITLPVSSEKKEELKCSFGKMMELIGKSETYLMVNIEDNKDMWLGGEKLSGGAYVSVSLLGSSSAENYEKMTKEICDIFEKSLSIDPKGVYVTYHPVADWGWNGSNF